MTAFYSFRLIFMTFHGKPRASEKVMSHVHESPAVMLGPLLVLATGAILAGGIFYQSFVGSSAHHGEHGGGHHVEEAAEAHGDHAGEHADDHEPKIVVGDGHAKVVHGDDAHEKDVHDEEHVEDVVFVSGLTHVPRRRPTRSTLYTLYFII